MRNVSRSHGSDAILTVSKGMLVGRIAHRPGSDTATAQYGLGLPPIVRYSGKRQGTPNCVHRAPLSRIGIRNRGDYFVGSTEARIQT